MKPRAPQPIRRLYVGMILILLSMASGSQGTPVSAPAANPNPVMLGVNIAGSYHMNHTDKLFYQFDAWWQAIDELGVQFVDVNFLIDNYTAPVKDTTASALAQLQAIDQGMRAHGKQYMISVELANWMESLELDPGVNEFEHADGSHRWDVRMDWLNQVLPPQKAGTPALFGINCDEGEHNQLVGCAYVRSSPPWFDMPYFLVTDGLSMESAFDGLVTQCQQIRTSHYEGKMEMGTEQVWPDMFHIFARAGWKVDPKLLKEELSSVIMSVALGAALEYADRGTDLWTCCDLFKLDNNYPGWAPEDLRSALLMSYWLGASKIYVENLDYSDSDPAGRNPLASPEGSLLHWIDPDHYELTNHGRVVQDFYKNYVPAHPRPFSWRDYKPRVAIVRLSDGAWGQKNSDFRDRLLGNSQHPMDEISAEWLHVWPILTHGAARDGGISLFKRSAYPEGIHYPFFLPINSVAVFDHYVKGPVLDSVDCFIVCGHALSADTFQAIKSRVKQGATCIIARRLYRQYEIGTLPGKWLVVDDFKDPAVEAALQPFLGPPDVARFRFRNHTVEFRAGSETAPITVNVLENQNSADKVNLTLE